MSIPQDLVTELNEYQNDDVYTPEIFAWKLLLDNTKSDVLSANLQTFTDTYDEADDPITFSFEVMITIFMELVFGILKLNHYAEGNDEEFEPDFSKHNIDDILPLLKHKFNELCYILSVEVIDDTVDNKSYIDSIMGERYCKIILRHNESDQAYFAIHDDDIDSDKDYHMILNGRFKQTKNLNEVHATCALNNKVYKISFDVVQTISKPLGVVC
jgi:hypothetical protein